MDFRLLFIQWSLSLLSQILCAFWKSSFSYFRNILCASGQVEIFFQSPSPWIWYLLLAIFFAPYLLGKRYLCFPSWICGQAFWLFLGVEISRSSEATTPARRRTETDFKEMEEVLDTRRKFLCETYLNRKGGVRFLLGFLPSISFPPSSPGAAWVPLLVRDPTPALVGEFLPRARALWLNPSVELQYSLNKASA